ncbi:MULTISPECIES: TAXI family TRAP transporter solute-binding subunit [Oligella]|uniref:C4-dicarboxylate ABC transporter substrate-binding protein n=2 Tax=Oligella urethralis TaxID=90245 RepID=A0A096AKR8_9BURK|nr:MULTISPECIES: TAXI family TRAP transporter solute-binding subunit [Oligella]AVL71293.1 C4-dicarboxylate ABC transporter substrate-binding protein [Oligella urethralis]KGF31252.1 C4-dicarboxylate ABC transporter substrate-binding protein [Oligella urethralis DNF00040]MDK6202806.1 TAXI family TRAP transporter solute-binding subunit [Oligella urethralis]OFS87722.1 C4-dicarboxylate ABC transporter substrate-binding protein [Oligella sp. HMSC05A10]OFV47705.1 C4-dicarboxylate ABC transporter subs
MYKKLLLTATLAVSSIFATAQAENPKFLSMLTGGTGGTYYPLGGAIAKIISDETGIKTDALSSNASADNIIAVNNGEAEIAFTQTDVAAYAIDGVNNFEGKKVEGIQALGSLYPETVQIVTTDKSGIKTVNDLKGKKVSVGAPGSGTYVSAEQILEVYGLNMNDIRAQHLDFGESVGGIQDGNIDAAFITAGTPTGAVEQLTATAKVNVLPIDGEEAKKLIDKYPFYGVNTIKQGTYGLANDVNTVAVLAMLVVKKDLPEDAVYNITKAIYENVDKISHAKAKEISLNKALDGVGFDLHPGAKKYYEEKGLEVK